MPSALGVGPRPGLPGQPPSGSRLPAYPWGGLLRWSEGGGSCLEVGPGHSIAPLPALPEPVELCEAEPLPAGRCPPAAASAPWAAAQHGPGPPGGFTASSSRVHAAGAWAPPAGPGQPPVCSGETREVRGPNPGDGGPGARWGKRRLGGRHTVVWRVGRAVAWQWASLSHGAHG